MTCIVGVKDNNKSYMAADQFLGHTGLSLRTAQKKIIRIGNMLIGISGRPRDMNLLKHFIVFPEDGYECPEAYIVKEVVPSLRSLFKDHGAVSKNNEIESFESYFLIGYKHRFFEVSSNYQVTETIDDYAATGSGMDFALGSLHSTKLMRPRDRAIAAIEAAIAHCPTVSGNIQVEEL